MHTGRVTQPTFIEWCSPVRPGASSECGWAVASDGITGTMERGVAAGQAAVDPTILQKSGCGNSGAADGSRPDPTVDRREVPSNLPIRMALTLAVSLHRRGSSSQD